MRRVDRFSDVVARLFSRGAVGTLYHIRRQLNDTGEFAFIGTSGGEKSFMDETLPAGTRTCTYELTALRSTRRGSPGRYSMSFGGALRLPLFQSRDDLRAA